MKKIILLLILMAQLAALPASASSITGGDRKRFYVIAGIGYASSYPEGFLVEAGVEVRLFGNIHTRLMVDYYPGMDERKDNITLKHMSGITLYGIYKMKVSETVDFRVKAGGHYSRIRAEMTALGLTFNTTMADIGFSAGAGFSWQWSNTLYLYGETTVKYLMLDEPWTWVKGQLGIMLRLR